MAMSPLAVIVILLLPLCRGFMGPYCPIGLQAISMFPNLSFIASSGQASDGRLYGPGWLPTVNDTFLQIDLGRVVTITGVATQGFGASWVSSFQLDASIDGLLYNVSVALEGPSTAGAVTSTLFAAPNGTGDVANSTFFVNFTGPTSSMPSMSSFSARYVRFIPLQGSPSLPASLGVELYTPCVFAEFFGWQPGRGMVSTGPTVTANPPLFWTLRQGANLSETLTLGSSSTFATTTQTGLLTSRLDSTTGPLFYLSSQVLDLTDFFWANMTAYMVDSSSNNPPNVLIGVVNASTAIAASVAWSRVTNPLQSPVLSLPLRPVRAFVRQTRFSGLNVNTLLQAVWIDGRAKSCAQITGVISTLSGECRACNGTTEYQDEIGQTACKAVTPCGLNTYQSSAPTPSTNRVCLGCGSCSQGEYQASACTPFANTRCAPCLQDCTQCADNRTCTRCVPQNRFLAVDGTACLTSCPSGLFSTDESNANYCQPCAAPCETCQDDNTFCLSCVNGTFLQGTACPSRCDGANYGNFVTRRCTPLTVCGFPPQFEAVRPGDFSDRVCGNISQCPAGQQQTLAPTPTSDRVCVNCSAGTIDHDSNYNTSCIPCPAGTYTPPGSFGAACPVCPAGTTDHDSNPSTPCLPCAEAGLYVPPNSTGSCSLFKCAAGTLDQDMNSSTPCNFCRPGFNLSAPGLFGPCENHPCPAGTTDLDRLTSSDCVRCPAGSFLPATSSGPCSNFVCAAGTIDDDFNPATACVPCTAPGLFVPSNSSGNCSLFKCAPGTLDGDSNSSTACTTCPAGTNLSAAGLFGNCAQYECPLGTSNVDSSPASGCLACPPGSFVPRASFGACANFRCANGTSDVDLNPATACVACSDPGLFVPVGSSGNCSLYACPIGSIDGDNSSATPCTTCPAGTDLSRRGMFGACESRFCLAGTIDEDRNTSTACTLCPRGGFVPPGQSGACAAFVCLNGTIDDDNTSSTPCVGCLGAGLFVPRNSSGNCSSFQCFAGTIDHDRNSSTMCTTCAPGTDLSVRGRFGSCSSFACPLGTIDGDLNPATACTWCPPGAFVPAGQSGSCAAFVCQAGFIDADSNASTACVQCSVPGLGLYVPQNASGNCSTYVCPIGTLDADLSAATPCTTCDPGTSLNRAGLRGTCSDFLCAPGTSDTDSDPSTACVPCPAGVYVPAGQAGACSLYLCAAGTSDTDNRSSTECEACTQAGLYVPRGSAGSCTAYPCPVNSTDDDARSDTVCIGCGPGTQLATTGLFGACSTHRCAAGTIDGDSDPATACQQCGAGTYVPQGSFGDCARFACLPGSVDADLQSATACTDCAAGTFQGASGQVSCNTCSPYCGSGSDGRFVSVACNKTDDITCANCSVCPAGYAAACTNFTDAVCASPSSSSSSGGLAVVAGAAGGGVLVLLLLILVVVLVKKKKSQAAPSRVPTENQMILPRTESLLPDMKLFEPRGTGTASPGAPQTYVMLKDVQAAKQPTLYALPSESDVDLITTQETALNEQHLTQYAQVTDLAGRPVNVAGNAGAVYTAVNKRQGAPSQPVYSAVAGDESLYASAERQEQGAQGELLGPDGRPLYSAVNKTKKPAEALYASTDIAGQQVYAAAPDGFYAPLAEVKPEQPHPDGLIYTAVDVRLPGSATSPLPGSDDHVVYSAIDLRASGLTPAGATNYGNVADESHYANPDLERRPTLRGPEEI